MTNLEHIQSTKAPQGHKDDIRLPGKVRQNKFTLVAHRSGTVKRIEWDRTLPRDKDPAWFAKYRRERNRVLKELAAITGPDLCMTTALHGVPVAFDIMTGSGRTVSCAHK